MTIEEPKRKKPPLALCVARVLTRIYKEKSLTQEGIAEKANMARGTVIRALTLGRVTIPNLHKLCVVMGVRVSEVFKQAEIERANAPG